MSVQFPPCAYQRHVNTSKCVELCKQFTPLDHCGLNRSLQDIIAGYLVEVSCMSCRQVKEGGDPTIQVAVTFFKENLLREGTRRFPGKIVKILHSLTFEHRRLNFAYIRVEDPLAKFDLCVTNSWRYSLFNLYPHDNRYDEMNNRMPTAPPDYEERVCFHELSATCIRQCTLSSELPDVDDDHRDDVEDAMRQERDAITKELIAAAAEKRA